MAVRFRDDRVLFANGQAVILMYAALSSNFALPKIYPPEVGKFDTL